MVAIEREVLELVDGLLGKKCELEDFVSTRHASLRSAQGRRNGLMRLSLHNLDLTG